MVLGCFGLGRGHFGSRWATPPTNTWTKTKLGRRYAVFRIKFYFNVSESPKAALAWVKRPLGSQKPCGGVYGGKWGVGASFFLRFFVFS